MSLYRTQKSTNNPTCTKHGRLLKTKLFQPCRLFLVFYYMLKLIQTYLKIQEHQVFTQLITGNQCKGIINLFALKNTGMFRSLSVHTKESLKLSKTVKDAVDIVREEWKTFIHGSQLFTCKIDLNLSFTYKKKKNSEKENIYVVRSNLRKCIYLTVSVGYTCVGWSTSPRGRGCREHSD